MDREHYTLLVSELGGELGIPDLAPDAFGTCSLSFEDRLTLNLQFASDEEIILFSAIGRIIDSDPEAVIAAKDALLKANLFNRGTAGGTLGLEPDSGLIVLSRPEATEGLTAARLARRLGQFAAVALAWRERLSQPDGGATAPALTPPIEDTTGLRV